MNMISSPNLMPVLSKSAGQREEPKWVYTLEAETYNIAESLRVLHGGKDQSFPKLNVISAILFPYAELVNFTGEM